MNVKHLIALTLTVVFWTFVPSPALAGGHHEWWAHATGNGSGGSGPQYVCDRGNNGVYGPFDSKADCETFVAGLNGSGNGGGNDGGCGLEICPPPGPPPCESPAPCGPPPPPPPVGTLPAPPHGNGAFLCYSINGTPMSVDVKIDKALQDAGYWLPTAYPGTIAGGTNVGSDHLACNQPVHGQTAEAFTNTGQSYVDNNGALLDYDSASSTGFVGVYLAAS